MRCHLHPGSQVWSMGTYEATGGTRRRYKCVPRGGDQHTFSIVEAHGRARAWTPPPTCPEHPGSHVVRNGTYGVRTPKPRQRYRCTPADGSKAHNFTPALPRDHVHPAEGGCPECDELRGSHHGETSVARRHSWPTRLVARALDQLARGGSYADVSRQALRSAERIANRHDELVRGGLTLEQADAVVEAEEEAADRGVTVDAVAAVLAAAANGDPPRVPADDLARYRQPRYRRRRQPLTSPGPTPAERNDDAQGDAQDEDDVPVATTFPEDPPGLLELAAQVRTEMRFKLTSSAESRNAWHIAADWTEAFSPVVYAPVDERLRARAAAERRRRSRVRSRGPECVEPGT